jgi:small GTP-binding protein
VRAALLTPRAPGGIAVVALSGADRHAVAARLLAGAAVDDRPALRWLWLDGERLDQAVVVDRPRLATTELHVHASEAVLAGIERVVGSLAAHTSLRDSLLWSAVGSGQLDFALEQHRLLASYAGCFARFVAAHADQPAVLHAARARHAAAAALWTPCALALCGRKNAGKSTLMNRLLHADRVLAGPWPGLTRDAVREAVILEGYPYELIDTAGEGDPVDALDARAMARSRQVRALSHTVLVVDASAGIGEVERAILALPTTLFVVRTKMDLPHAAWPEDVPPPALEVTTVAPDPARGSAAGPVPGSGQSIRSAFGVALRRARGLPPAGPLGGVAPLDASEIAALDAAARG